MRSYISPALENIPLWHERDISHSSVERVILPDSFILLNYALNRLNDLLKSLQINTDKMRDNMEISSGRLFSSQALNILTQKGMERKKAYFLIQKLSQGLKKGEHLKPVLKKNQTVRKYLNERDLERIFSLKDSVSALLRHFEKTIKNL